MIGPIILLLAIWLLFVLGIRLLTRNVYRHNRHSIRVIRLLMHILVLAGIADLLPELVGYARDENGIIDVIGGYGTFIGAIALATFFYVVTEYNNQVRNTINIPEDTRRHDNPQSVSFLLREVFRLLYLRFRSNWNLYLSKFAISIILVTVCLHFLYCLYHLAMFLNDNHFLLVISKGRTYQEIATFATLLGLLAVLISNYERRRERQMQNVIASTSSTLQREIIQQQPIPECTNIVQNQETTEIQDDLDTQSKNTVKRKNRRTSRRSTRNTRRRR